MTILGYGSTLTVGQVERDSKIETQTVRVVALPIGLNNTHLSNGAPYQYTGHFHHDGEYEDDGLEGETKGLLQSYLMDYYDDDSDESEECNRDRETTKSPSRRAREIRSGKKGGHGEKKVENMRDKALVMVKALMKERKDVTMTQKSKIPHSSVASLNSLEEATFDEETSCLQRTSSMCGIVRRSIVPLTLLVMVVVTVYLLAR